MGFYKHLVLPHFCHLAMSNRRLQPYRQRVVGASEGRVLEVGIGSGRNLSFYARSVTEVLGLDPSPQLIAMARHAAERSAIPVKLLEASAEAIPLDDRSIDTIVMTWTLCTVTQSRMALDEMRRVLKPDGRLLFAEHGLAPDPSVRRWQNRLTPIWSGISGGCHLNRDIDDLIRTSGFHMVELHRGYMRGPKPMSYMYQGSARRA